MPYAGLDYYAFADSAPVAKLATYVREHGGVHRVLGRLAGLGAVDHDTARANLVAGMEYVHTHPLPRGASADVVRTRQLLVAALAQAQNKLQGSAAAGASDPAYRAVAQAFADHAAAAKRAEMPSAFLLALANAGDKITGAARSWGSLLANPTKLLLYAGLGLAAYLALPALLDRAGGTKHW